MSDSLTIAAITATLQSLLHAALLDAGADPVGGADVTTLSPAQLSSTVRAAQGPAALNVFLYRISESTAREPTLPGPLRGRRAEPTLPATVVDLHYLISAHGDEATLAPQQLITIAISALAATPVLTPAVVESATAQYGGIGPVTFPDQNVDVRPESLSLEETSHLWSLLGAPYVLSRTYIAHSVRI